jgi:hypothetical protein
MTKRTMVLDATLESELAPGSRRPWFLLILFAGVLLCGITVPVSALLRGVVRAGAVDIASNREWSGPLLVVGGPLSIEGTISGPVVVLAGPIRLQGRAADDLIALPGAIDVGSNAVAQGNVIALGGELRVAPTAAISGSKIGGRLPWAAGFHSSPRSDALSFAIERLRLAGLSIAALLLLGLAVWTLLPWPALVTLATARRFRFRSALIGIGTLIWAPLIVAPLAVSLAGLPLALLLGLALGGLWLVGVVSSAVRIGHRLLALGGRPHSILTSTLAGLVCLGLLPALPIVGSVVLLLAGCIGLGAALMALWDREAAGERSVTQTLASMTFPE